MKSNKEINHIHGTNYSNRDKDSQDFILGSADEREMIELLVRRST